MAWAIHFHPEVAEWLRGLGLRDLHRVTAAIDALTAVGPGLGRPLVGYIRTSRHSAMKELRPPGTHFRVLFAFDEERQAAMLVAGDKQHRWAQWYRDMAPLADERFDEHLTNKRSQGNNQGRQDR